MDIEKHREANRLRNKRYYDKHREIILERQAAYREKAPEILRATMKRWRENHPEKKRNEVRQHRAANPEMWVGYSKKYLPKALERAKEKRKTNPLYRLSCNLRSRLSSAIKHGQKSGSAVRDLGCTVEELKLYLQAKFQPGMTWDNHGTRGWHIDHIRPLSSFDLTDREQFLQACHYTNLQPLWARDNLTKSDSILDT